MSSFASLICYSAIKELNDSKNDIITAYARIIAPVILHNSSKLNYDVYSLIKDIKNEYSLEIPYHALNVIINKCRDLGYITLKHGIITPNKERIEADDFDRLKRSKEEQYRSFIDSYKEFLKEKYNEYISDEIAYEQINVFLENNSLSFIGNHELLYSGKNRWKVAEFLIENEENGNKEYVDCLNDYILGLSLTQLLSYEESNDKFTSTNLIVYIDTPIVFRLLGIDSLNRKDIYIDMLRQMQKRGIQIRLFEHTYNEVVFIIEESKQWINNPDFDETLSNETSYFFVSHNWTLDEIDTLSITAKHRIEEELNIKIDSISYPKENEIISINETDIESLIKQDYLKSLKLEEVEKKKYPIYYDAKSLFYIFQMCKGNIAYHFNDIKYLFLTTNSALTRVALHISKELHPGKNKASIIPFAMDDMSWGMILWLDTPSNLSNYSRSKLTAAAYASYRPSDIIIKKFYSSLIMLSEEGTISSAECYLLRTQPSARTMLLRITHNNEDMYCEQTPLEIIKQYKNEGYKKGIEEKDLEIEKIILQNQKVIQQKNKEYAKLQIKNNQILTISNELLIKKTKHSENKMELTQLTLNQKDNQSEKEYLEKELRSLKDKKELLDKKYSKFFFLIKVLITELIILLMYYFGRIIIKNKDTIEVLFSTILAILLIWGLPRLNITQINEWISKLAKSHIYKHYKWHDQLIEDINDKINENNKKTKSTNDRILFINSEQIKLSEEITLLESNVSALNENEDEELSQTVLL